MKFKKLLKLDEARVELDTVDFDSELFQEYIKRNDIKTRVINPKGPAGGWPVIEYVGTKRVIEMLIHRFFGDDDLKDLIEEGMEPEEKVIRTYKKGNDKATLKKQEDNSILIVYNLTGHKSGAGLKTEFRTANDATRWLEGNGWELDELHEGMHDHWAIGGRVGFKNTEPGDAKLTQITVDVPVVFGADWRKTHKSMDNLKKLAELFTDEQDMVTIEGYPEVKGNKILFPIYTDVTPDKKAVDKFINAFKEWAKNGELTESAENRKLSKAKISAAHKKILNSGYIYIGTTGRTGHFDDEVTEHNYISKDYKNKKIMSYSAYSLDYDKGPDIKIETIKNNFKEHSDLKEGLIHEEEQDKSTAMREQIKEDIEELRELQEQMTDTLEQMEQVLRKYRKEGLYKRAEAYWLAHAKMALTNEHGYLGKSQVSLQDTIEELEEMLEDEEE